MTHFKKFLVNYHFVIPHSHGERTCSSSPENGAYSQHHHLLPQPPPGGSPRHFPLKGSQLQVIQAAAAHPVTWRVSFPWGSPGSPAPTLDVPNSLVQGWFFFLPVESSPPGFQNHS